MNNRLKVLREILNPFWMKSRLRCSLAWGPKGQGNPYSGKNIVMIVGKEAVVVSEELNMREFYETSNTGLGRRVYETAAKAGLLLVKPGARQVKSLIMVAQEALPISDCFWHCPKCKQGEAIQGEGQEALEKAYVRHEEISIDCPIANMKFYQWINGELVERPELAQITSVKRP